MIRGTTPTLEFTIPFDTNLLEEAYVTLAQNKKIVIDKSLSECRCSDNVLSVKLTQEETLLLSSNSTVEIQIRARTKDGNAVASEIMAVSPDRILKDGVI